MPKGKRNGKYEKRQADQAASDEDSINDNGSVTSSVSDVKSILEDGVANFGNGEGEGEEIEEHDMFEDKLKDAIDGATQKSVKVRQTSLESMAKALTSRFVYDFVSERRMTITDCVERSLKRGKGAEQEVAALLAVLLCIQLGAGDESEATFKELKQVLLTVGSDVSVSPKARGKCFTALGLCSFFALGEDSLLDIMQYLESQFRPSYLKGNGATPNLTPELTAMHASALLSWSLLLTLVSPTEILTTYESHLYKLPELLESPDVEVRIAAGDAIAIFYEIIRDLDDGFYGNDMDDLCDKLKQLATDSQKFRAKKERKHQRSSFRDILKGIEENEAPLIQIRFGREVLELDSWCRKRQYEAICHVLGSGMNLHLAENDLLREVFGLGAPIPTNGPVNKVSKFERHMVNVAAFKARTVALSKVRDKRSIVY